MIESALRGGIYNVRRGIHNIGETMVDLAGRETPFKTCMVFVPVCMLLAGSAVMTMQAVRMAVDMGVNMLAYGSEAAGFVHKFIPAPPNQNGIDGTISIQNIGPYAAALQRTAFYDANWIIEQLYMHGLRLPNGFIRSTETLTDLLYDLNTLSLKQLLITIPLLSTANAVVKANKKGTTDFLNRIGKQFYDPIRMPNFFGSLGNRLMNI